MPRMPIAERRQQLVEAAIAVMTRDGVRKATTRAIASEAGTSLSVFHYCFDSKQELLESVVTTIVGKTVTLAEESLAQAMPSNGATMDKKERLDVVRLAMHAYWDHVTANPEEHLLTYEVTQFCLRDPEFAHVAQRQYELYAQAYVMVFENVGLTSTWPVATVARLLAVTFDGLTLDWLVRRDSESSVAVLDAVAQQLNAVLVPVASS
ncbi:hypothetical protein N802_03680 [Knoellia sinensis KCTC 19936]|uniref:HTH tetR-type domain-containing protein n=1 Tax=Knoellia sinensis KCTC 19936 TaxID=1385520 RepID=A0A0A0J5Z2_9MICO|nr:TetR/AcrR family transcriptional regulator [Knoellia sinensis]KGN31477.1 hypothetical protein N802_03680 [Knoellia sinensis KCTC 19936]